jgi:hypothetical protein
MAYFREAIEFSGRLLAFQAPRWATTELGFFERASKEQIINEDRKRILLNKLNFIVD